MCYGWIYIILEDDVCDSVPKMYDFFGPMRIKKKMSTYDNEADNTDKADKAEVWRWAVPALLQATDRVSPNRHSRAKQTARALNTTVIDRQGTCGRGG